MCCYKLSFPSIHLYKCRLILFPTSTEGRWSHLCAFSAPRCRVYSGPRGDWPAQGDRSTRGWLEWSVSGHTAPQRHGPQTRRWWRLQFSQLDRYVQYDGCNLTKHKYHKTTVYCIKGKYYPFTHAIVLNINWLLN